MSDQYFTEFIRELSVEEIFEMDKAIGANCDKCNTSSSKLFHRKYYFDGLPAHHVLCQNCVDKIKN